jgi:multidrug efflux pump subunit AcrB
MFLESMSRRMEHFGEAPMIASVNEAKAINFSMLSVILSLAAVVIPLILMSGQINLAFHEFSVTIRGAILASSLVFFTLTPMICTCIVRSIQKYAHQT